MKLTQQLTDFARVTSDGKLDMFGAGWTIVSANEPPEFFVAGMLQIPYDQTNDADHTIRVELLDADGASVVNLDGDPICVAATIRVARTPELKPAIPVDFPFVFRFGPHPLSPGRYEIRTTINGEQREDWSLPFTIREAMPEELAA